MITDGIMKQNSKNSNIKLLLIVLIVFVIVKALWVFVEFKWLPSIGIDHIQNRDIKALYYRVKLAHNEHKVQTPKQTIQKPVSSIKDIQLLAIYTTQGYAVVTVQYKGKTKVLSTGEEINGFKLLSASMQYALFAKNGKTYKVELPKIKDTSKYISSISPENPTKTNKELVTGSDNYKVINKDVFEHFANNIDDIYKNIAIKDIKQGNKILFKVSFIKRGSIFAKLGIKRGDIIKSVNGEEIDSYTKAFSIYRGIKNMQNLTIVVIRNNKEVELEYEIN